MPRPWPRYDRFTLAFWASRFRQPWQIVATRAVQREERRYLWTEAVHLYGRRDVEYIAT